MVEETRVSVSGEAQDVGVAAVMTAPTVTAQAATDIVIPVVQLPDSSEEYGDSRDIDPAAAASAADKITEFTSACAEVLDAGTSGGPQHGAIIQSVVPPEFLRNEREEEAVWQAQFEAGSQIQNHLERALELHRTTDYQFSQVSGSSPRIVRIFGPDFACFTHSFPFAAAERYLAQKERRDDPAELPVKLARTAQC